MSEKLGRIQCQYSGFLITHSLFFKGALFSARSTHVCTQQGALPPTNAGAAASLAGFKGLMMSQEKF